MSEAPLDMNDYTSSSSDHLTVDDFGGGPRVLTIKETGSTGETGKGSRPVWILFAGEPLAFLPSKTCRRILSRIWPEASKRANKEYPGRSLRLFVDPTVTYGNDTVGGIRINGATHIDKAVTGTTVSGRNKRAPFRVEPIKVETTPSTAERIANAERIMSELAPEWLETLQERSGAMDPAAYLAALGKLHRDVTTGGAE